VGRDERRVGVHVDAFRLSHLADLLRERHPAQQVGDPLLGGQLRVAVRRFGLPFRRGHGLARCLQQSDGQCRHEGGAEDGAAMGAQHRCFSLPDQEAGRAAMAHRSGVRPRTWNRRKVD
jgi:hypothetical protein